tara:strand:- start:252 stop:758 length:507 start_codon:yes stop_codon:yes gene_type:complete
MLEASVHAEYNLKNRLITLSQNAITLPAIELSGLTTSNTLTFEDGDSEGLQVVATLKGFAQTGNNQGIYFVIIDPTVVSTNATFTSVLSGPSRQFLREQDIPNAREYTVSGAGPDWSMKFMPDTEMVKAGRETHVYVVHRLTGAYTSFKVVNNLTRLKRNVLSNATIG